MSGDINVKSLLSTYQKDLEAVQSGIQSVRGSASGQQMGALFKLQLAMNQLSMFGTTLTNLIEGQQQIAMGITRNVKGQ